MNNSMTSDTFDHKFLPINTVCTNVRLKLYTIIAPDANYANQAVVHQRSCKTL